MTSRWSPAVVAVVMLVLAGCGVPTSGEPRRIPPSDVPYGLASPTPSTPSEPPSQTMVAEAGVYLVTTQNVLVLRGRELPVGGLQQRLADLLDQLAAGPSRQELADELSTALPPEVELDVSDITGGTVTVDIAGPVDAPTGAAGRLAVGQIVLTATSVAGVRAVRLTRDGDPIDAPLPDGALTSDPLTAAQFQSFLVPPPPPTATPAPTSTPPAPVPPAPPSAAPSS